ncbi:primase-helicase family protein [Flavobacterium anhuiense]|uniref:primase-helicase family protein n=1 Tax=Flavobacterium anhuiense TaxID=459526 RepID=UPI0034D98336
MNKQNVQFWTNENEKQVKIIQSKLTENLNARGYANLRINATNYQLVKCFQNRLMKTSEYEIIRELNYFLENHASPEVREIFARGVGTYISSKKLSLLNTLEFKKDRDPKNSSDFYFNNCFCRVLKDGIKVLDYEKLDSLIWEDKIIKKDFVVSNDTLPGDFEVFCRNLTFNNEIRFKAFKTMIGFLLHRNKEIGEAKAIILYDEHMGVNGQAHGGTGKTLIIKAIEKCRECAYVSGKELKTGSFFKNQRINITTDIIAYDDLKENVDFEDFYTTVSSSIEVEKKGKQSFLIEYEDAPKILMSSNYLIKGDGGNSDLRRRYEFEIANHYHKDFTPEMEFGKRFFGSDWQDNDWNKFFLFMMTCVHEYLNFGLLEADCINLRQTRTEDKSCPEFIEFAKTHLKIGEWINKREYNVMFQEAYPQLKGLSSHKFTKWIKDYALDLSIKYLDKSSGGDYFFILKNQIEA